MMDSSLQNAPEWFSSWFNHPFYLKLYSHRDEDEARMCVETILRVALPETAEPSGFRIMDIACGAGRHAIEFARKGFCVTANDLSPYLMQCARDQASTENLSMHCTERDMRDIEEQHTFHLVVQLFSSFGYFESEQDDRQVLDNVFQALLPGGRYVLDLINAEYLKNKLCPHSRKAIDNLTVDEHRQIIGNRVIKDICITSPEETLEFQESVRLFEPAHIKTMLLEAGFEVEQVLGDYNGTPFSAAESPRMLIFCRKPSA